MRPVSVRAIRSRTIQSRHRRDWRRRRAHRFKRLLAGARPRRRLGLRRLSSPSVPSAFRQPRPSPRVSIARRRSRHPCVSKRPLRPLRKPGPRRRQPLSIRRRPQRFRQGSQRRPRLSHRRLPQRRHPLQAIAPRRNCAVRRPRLLQRLLLRPLLLLQRQPLLQPPSRPQRSRLRPIS